MRREVSDPRIGFITVTSAEVSPDLRCARIFVSVLGTPEQVTATMKGLNSAAGFIRGAFGKRAQLRFTPTLEFRSDQSAERAAHIHALLASVKPGEEDGEPEDPPGSAGDSSSG